MGEGPMPDEEGGVTTTVAARRVGGDGPDGRTLYLKVAWRLVDKSFDLLITDGTDAWQATGERSRDRLRSFVQ
jgi:hypothetical protein